MCGECKSLGYEKCSKCREYVTHTFNHEKSGTYGACLKCMVAATHEIYSHHNTYEWIECMVCGFRSGDVSAHIKIHNMTAKEYKEKYNKGVKPQKAIDRFKGENNPGYRHGGKLSPFSKKYIKYSNILESEVEDRIKRTKANVIKTREDNNSITTRLEYYTSRGYSEEDAKIALKKRQSSFTLEKCIEKYGEVGGVARWKERQRKWQETLRSKPQEEIEEINKRKSHKMTYENLYNHSLDDDGYFYVIKLDDNVTKIGITTKDSIYDRYGYSTIEKVDVVVFREMDDINHAFMVEQVLKRFYSNKIKKCDYGKFGWTEIIHDTNIKDILKSLSILLEDKNSVNKLFEYYLDK